MTRKARFDKEAIRKPTGQKEREEKEKEKEREEGERRRREKSKRAKAGEKKKQKKFFLEKDRLSISFDLDT